MNYDELMTLYKGEYTGPTGDFELDVRNRAACFAVSILPEGAMPGAIEEAIQRYDFSSRQWTRREYEEAAMPDDVKAKIGAMKEGIRQLETKPLGVSIARQIDQLRDDILELSTATIQAQKAQ